MFKNEQKRGNCLETKDKNANNTDRRVRRTRQLLHQALLELILEKGYEAVTVQDILDRADVGRSTFYSHFLDKEDLLVNGLEQLRNIFIEQHEKILTEERRLPEKNKLSPEELRMKLTLVIFEHVKSHHGLYKALVRDRGGQLVIRHFQHYVNDLVREHLGAAEVNWRHNNIPVEVLVHFMGSSLMDLIIWWLDNDLSYSPAQMNQWFHQLAVQSIMV
jgi:AcrR family transcriptional regulator